MIAIVHIDKNQVVDLVVKNISNFMIDVLQFVAIFSFLFFSLLDFTLFSFSLYGSFFRINKYYWKKGFYESRERERGYIDLIIIQQFHTSWHS
jgi:hypothetical protein